MIAKIIAGPLGFYSFVAPDYVNFGPTMYTEINQYLGPLRQHKLEADADLEIAVAAMGGSGTNDNDSENDRYGFLSNDQLTALVRIAKDPRKGARPFFNNPKNMIELRTEAANRGLV